MSPIPHTRLFLECGILYVLSLVATFANHAAPNPASAEIAFVGVLAILLGGPYVCRRFVHRRSAEDAGAEIVLSLHDAWLGLVTALLLVLPVGLGVWFWYTQIQGMTFSPAWHHYAALQPGILESLVTQLFLVAMPEEFFYRGYAFATLRDGFSKAFAWSPRRTHATVIVVTSLMFAVAHTMGGDPVRLNTFFPARLFGLLRTRCDGILGCILLHACCNLMMQLMLVHFVFA